MSRSRLILGILIAGALAGLGYAGYLRYLAPLPATPTEAVPAQGTASSGAARVVTAEGIVIPARDAALAFAGAERIASVLVMEGEQVQAGQTLMRLDASAAQAGVAQAEAVANQAEAAVIVAQANLDRFLAGPRPQDTAVADAQQKAARAQVSQAEAALEAAQAGLDVAEAQLARTELAAPFDGTVVKLNAEVGELAVPGAPVLILADLTDWQVQTNDLAETDVVLIQPGQTASVTLDALPGQAFAGAVTKISALAETIRGNVTYPVTIDLGPTTAPLRWGMTAFVDIEVGN